MLTMSDPDFTSTTTLHDLAKVAGVSVMTVSRALRGEPRVAPETRRRLLALAEEMGYTPDPDLARLMHRVRSRKKVKFRAVIAVIREWVPEDNLLGPSYQYVSLEAIRDRARGHGYEVEEFWLGRNGLTPRKLESILQARGIEAVIVSPQSNRLLCAEVDYTPFASVAFGYAMREPAVHRSASGGVPGRAAPSDRPSRSAAHRRSSGSRGLRFGRRPFRSSRRLPDGRRESGSRIDCLEGVRSGVDSREAPPTTLGCPRREEDHSCRRDRPCRRGRPCTSPTTSAT